MRVNRPQFQQPNCKGRLFILNVKVILGKHLGIVDPLATRDLNLAAVTGHSWWLVSVVCTGTKGVFQHSNLTVNRTGCKITARKDCKGSPSCLDSSTNNTVGIDHLHSTVWGKVRHTSPPIAE